MTEHFNEEDLRYYNSVHPSAQGVNNALHDFLGSAYNNRDLGALLYDTSRAGALDIFNRDIFIQYFGRLLEAIKSGGNYEDIITVLSLFFTVNKIYFEKVSPGFLRINIESPDVKVNGWVEQAKAMMNESNNRWLTFTELNGNYENNAKAIRLVSPIGIYIEINFLGVQ